MIAKLMVITFYPEQSKTDFLMLGRFIERNSVPDMTFYAIIYIIFSFLGKLMWN